MEKVVDSASLTRRKYFQKLGLKILVFDARLAERKMPQSGIVQALYATPVWACFFLMYFILGGYVKYNFLEGGAR